MSNNSDGQITLSLAIKKTLANIQAGLKQISDKLFVNVTGKLNKSKTRTQIKNDLNSLNTDVKVVGKLDKSATKRKIKADMNSLNDSASIDVKANINTKDLKNKLNNLKSKSSTIKVDADINGSKNLDKVSEGMESINKKSVSTIANINLVNRAINGLEQAARKMVQTSVDLNEKLTDIRMVTGKNYEEAEKLVYDYNALAKELGSTTVEILDGASEWQRQGKTDTETTELIKQSTILSKVGAMDSATATERLTSAMNGYKMEVSDVSGIVDKFISVDMAAAVSADELAEALSHTASSAYLAGVDIDKIISYITVVEETTRKSASVVGESFKTIFARMGKVTNGDAVDDMGEDISKVEETLRGLGIELRKSADEFKDSDVVLDEVGSKWSTFSSVKQREIATAFGGVYQSENFIALMNNYDKVSKYVDIAANSAGTAAEKFQAYEESVKAHANEFLAAAESLSMNAIPADFMNSIISAGTALVEFIDNTHLLQLTLNNIVAVGAVKGFSLIGTTIKDVTQSVKQLSSAFNILDNSNSILSTSEFEKLLSVTKGLSESQLRLVISSKTLTNQQRIAILTANGLTTEEAEQTIATLGLATAEGAATTATFSLSGAMKALKAAFLSNPIGILAVALTTLISLITMGVDKIKTMKEEARQAAIDSANAAADSSNEIIELTNNYLKLSEEVKTNATVKENLITTEDTLLSKLGLEGSRVDELVAKYGNLSDAIKAASVEKLQEDERDLRGGLTAKAETALEKAKPSGMAKKGMNHLITTWDKDDTEINHKALNALVDAGYISSGSFGSRGMELWLTDMDLTTIEGVISAHDQLGKMLDVVQTKAGSNNEVYKELYTRYNNCTKSIQAYKDGISDLNKNLAQQYTMQGLIGKEVPKTQKEFEDYRNSVIKSAKASGEFEGSAEDIANAIDSILASNSQFADFMKKAESPETDISSIDAKIKAYNELTEKILNCTDAQEKNKLIAEQNALGKELENIAKLTSQYDDLTAAYENWQKAQSSENEGSKYDTISKDLENIKKLYEDGLVGTDDFKAAVQLMSNQDLTNATVEQLKSAFEKSYPSMQKYFKDGDEGCKAFLNDISKINSEWAHINENGDWEINFNDEDVAEKLDISVGALQAIMKKLKEFGFDINLSTSIESLADLKSATEAANDKLKELGKTEIDFNVNSTNVGDLIGQIDSASKILDTFRKEDGTVDLSVEGAQEAKIILAALIYQKQQVSEPAIIELNFNAETAKTEIESAALLVNDFRTKYRELEVKIATGEDTSTLQTEIQGIINKIGEVPNEIKTKLGLDSESFTTSVETLTKDTVDVKAGITLDAAALATFNATLLNISPEMLVKAGLDDTLIKNYIPDEKSATVKYKVDDSAVKKYNPPNLNRTVYYTVKQKGEVGARGTAFAQGNWGASKSGVALGGELGQELVVRDGKFFTIGDDGAEFFNYQKDDIIFNAEQTKQIFEKGKISSGNRRGRALVEGTAFKGGTTTGTGRFPSDTTKYVAPTDSSTSPNPSTAPKTTTEKSDEETEFERQYKYHQHLLAMDSETVQEYLDWLVVAYKEAYNAGQMELDDFYKYEEEVYEKSKSLFDDLIGDSEHQINLWENQGGNERNIINEYKVMQQAVHEQAEYYRSLGLSEENDKIQELQKQWWDYENEIRDTNAKIYEDIVKNSKNTIALNENWLNNAAAEGDYEKVKEYSGNIINEYKEMQKAVHEQAEYYRSLGYSDTSDEVSELSNLWWDYQEAIVEAGSSGFQILVDNAHEALDKIQNVYDTLKSAAQEYGDNGFISPDTYQDIMSMGVEYLAMLKNQNGQLEINERTINRVIKAKTEQLGVETALNYVEQLRTALTNNDVTALNNLLDATDAATKSTWDLVYAQLATLDLTDSQFNTAVQRINTIRSLTDTAISGVGQTTNSIADGLSQTSEALQQILDYTIEVIKQETENKIENLEEQISSYKEIVDLQKESLANTKEQSDYDDTVSDKLKEIAKIQNQINQLSLDDSREAQAEKKSLEEELANLQNDLSDYQADYAYDATAESLDKMAEAYEEEKNDEIEILRDNISSYQKLYDLAIQRIEDEGSSLKNTLIAWNEEYGSSLTSEITTAWNNAKKALIEYEYEYEKTVKATNTAIESSEKGDNRTVSDSSYSTSYYTNTTANSIVAQMKSNSSAWGSTDDADKRSQLAEANQKLGKRLVAIGVNAVYNSGDGTWYIGSVGETKLYDEYPKYHTGGIVGAGSLKDKEMMAVLEEGEIVLDESKKKAVQQYFELGTVFGDLSKKFVAAFGGAVSNSAANKYNEIMNKDIAQTLSQMNSDNSTNCHIDKIEVTAPIQVTEKLDKAEIKKHAQTIGEVSAEYIKEGFTKRGIKPTTKLF